MTTSERRFAELERLLADPAATGAFVFDVAPGSPAAEAGIVDGDTIVAVDGGAVVDAGTLFNALKLQGGADRRRARLRRADGAEAEVTLRAGRPGVRCCPVTAGKPAWTPTADYEEGPDFSSLLSGRTSWARIGFEQDLAGYERVICSPEPGGIAIDYLFHMGGDNGGNQWTYRAHVRSRHRMDRWLSALAIETTLGGMGPDSRSATERQADRGWSGWKEEGGGARQPTVAPASAASLNAYAVSLLCATMPQRAGAAVTFTILDDVDGRPTERCRLECVREATVRIDRRPIQTWLYAWRHYGECEESEKFYLDTNREIVRIEWGPGYNNCWCERVDAARVTEGLPAHIRVEGLAAGA